MFFDPPQSSASDGSGRLPGGLAPVTAAPSQPIISFWWWFLPLLICSLTCLLLNAFFSLASIIERERTFKSSFYMIIIIFAVTVVCSNLCDIIYLFVVCLGGVKSNAIENVSLVVDLAFAYFSTLLIFFMGLNRFAAFSSSFLKDLLMNRKTLFRILIGLLVSSLLLSVVIYKLSGLERSFEVSSMTDHADFPVPIQVSNYVFYALPLSSSFFYLSAFKSLRLQRSGAVSGTTIALLDKAENCNLKQGIWILFIYLASLIIHVVMDVWAPKGLSLVLLTTLQTFTSAAPQIALPLSVIFCSKDARDAVRHICWSSLKSNISKVFSSRHPVVSDFSAKTFPITLQSDITAKTA